MLDRLGITLASRAGRVLASAAGRALGRVFFLLGKARPRHGKALHPEGAIVQGVLRRRGSQATTGVAWLDSSGIDRVTVRLSRSVGMPRQLPDIYGLAVRVPVGDGPHGDLLLATTGTGTVTRFLLRPAFGYDRARYSTLFPYRTPTGPVWLAAFPVTDRSRTFELRWARTGSDWRTFSTLELAEEADATFDATVSFDPVINVVPGRDTYEWTRRLREFSYAASRRARDASS